MEETEYEHRKPGKPFRIAAGYRLWGYITQNYYEGRNNRNRHEVPVLAPDIEHHFCREGRYQHVCQKIADKYRHQYLPRVLHKGGYHFFRFFMR